MPGLNQFDISHEEWRDYRWEWEGIVYRYTIENPKTLYLRPGGTTHRVVDSDGIVHCVPSVGVMGCVLRWKNPDGTPPVNF